MRTTKHSAPAPSGHTTPRATTQLLLWDAPEDAGMGMQETPAGGVAVAHSSPRGQHGTPKRASHRPAARNGSTPPPLGTQQGETRPGTRAKAAARTPATAPPAAIAQTPVTVDAQTSQRANGSSPGKRPGPPPPTAPPLPDPAAAIAVVDTGNEETAPAPTASQPAVSGYYLGWVDDSPRRSIGEKIADAIAAYRTRFGRDPHLILVHEAVLADACSAVPGLAIRSAPWVLLHHVLVQLS